jgi:Putative adhesin
MPENSYEFTCTGPVQTEVELGAGALLVTAGDDLTATVTIAPADGREGSRAAADQTMVEFDRDRLSIHTPRSGWNFLRGGGQLRIEVRLPVDSDLLARLGSADLRTTGRLGTVEVKTGSGDVSVAETSGDLRVQSGSGAIRTDVIGRELSVTTASGDVSASRVGAATVKGASADISIEETQGPVRLNTASGDIRIGAVRGPELHANSASGDVMVGVPAGTQVWLDLNTVSGSTMSDLQMTGQAAAEGPVTTVQIRTVSGDIQIRRVS